MLENRAEHGKGRRAWHLPRWTESVAVGVAAIAVLILAAQVSLSVADWIRSFR